MYLHVNLALSGCKQIILTLFLKLNFVCVKTSNTLSNANCSNCLEKYFERFTCLYHEIFDVIVHVDIMTSNICVSKLCMYNVAVDQPLYYKSEKFVLNTHCSMC